MMRGWNLGMCVCLLCALVACGDDAKSEIEKTQTTPIEDVGGEDIFVEEDVSEDIAPDEGVPDVEEEGCGIEWINTNSTGEPSEIFAYEASRPDATADSQGVAENTVCSTSGVMPWTNVSYDEAIAACARVGAKLCEPLQWDDGCRGPERSMYPYGNTYDGARCGTLDSDNGCLNGTCAAATTGAYEGCVSSIGVFDMSGNVAEWILDQRPFGEEVFSIRGGSYQSANDNTIRCRNPNFYQPRDTRTEYIGFRCCRAARQ